MNDLVSLLFLLGSFTLVLFSFVVIFGAPYLPTLSPQINTALDMVDLKPGQTLIELGSGDGRVMAAAAERGLHVIGYELNPILAFYSWLRTRKYRGRVRVVCANFWQRPLPPADGIFVFLLPKYMEKLNTKIIQECSKDVKLVSFAFHIPGKKIIKKKNGVYLYSYQ